MAQESDRVALRRRPGPWIVQEPRSPAGKICQGKFGKRALASLAGTVHDHDSGVAKCLKYQFSGSSGEVIGCYPHRTKITPILDLPHSGL